MMRFEYIGYTVEYHHNGRYLGSVRLDEPDRDKLGFYGRRRETLAEDLQVVKNGGKTAIIKAGTEVMTQCDPICGRAIGRPRK